jgi:hypothetical protein
MPAAREARCSGVDAEWKLGSTRQSTDIDHPRPGRPSGITADQLQVVHAQEQRRLPCAFGERPFPPGHDLPFSCACCLSRSANLTWSTATTVSRFSCFLLMTGCRSSRFLRSDRILLL